MRIGGKLHLGHYHGMLKNWINLQYEYQCLFMIADIQSLSSQYSNTTDFKSEIIEMVITWLSTGVDPSQATIFIQSQVPEHLELQGILSMITPISWLERTLSHKELIDQQYKNIDTFGSLGSPLLQSSDILLYKSKYVPVGSDNLSNIEFTREISRRFNYLYGREDGFESRAILSAKKLGPQKFNLYMRLLTQYQQEGNDDSLEEARSLIEDNINIANLDKERLLGFLENKGKIILHEPQALEFDGNTIVGLDGRQMSRNLNNTINLLEDDSSITLKIKDMQTDPARIRLTDKGSPSDCPVWMLHQTYSSLGTINWVKDGCENAKIGCLECKANLAKSISTEQSKFRSKADEYRSDINLVQKILADGREKAREIASETLKQVKKSMNIYY